MPFEEKKHNFAYFVIIMIVIVGVIFVCFGKKIERTKGLHTWVFGNEFMNWDFSTKSTVSSTDLIVPPSENEWCKVQEIMVGTSNEDPTRDRIIGWDNTKNCCVRSVTGFNCALKKETDVNYCYTGNIGGKIIYVSIDNYFGDKDLYKEYVSDLDKVEIPNKPCSIEKYPEQLKV